MDSKWLNMPIGDEMEARIKTALKLKQTDKIPDTAILKYWQIEQCCRRLGSPVRNAELILLACFMQVVDEVADESPFDIVVRKRKVSPGTKVIARYKNQPRWGEYIKIDRTDKKVHVSLDDDPADFRRFKYTSVHLPTEEERAQLMGEK